MTTAPPVEDGNSGKLPMSWDDDQEETQVFDREKDRAADASSESMQSREPEDEHEHDRDDGLPSPSPVRARLASRASSPPSASSAPRTSSAIPAAAPIVSPPPPSASISGAFAALGQPRDSSPPSTKLRSGPPTSGSIRTLAPPPPPPMTHRQVNLLAQPVPPPPGMGVTLPIPIAQQPAALPPPRPPQIQTMQSAQSPVPNNLGSTPPPPHASNPPVYPSAPPSAHPPNPVPSPNGAPQPLMAPAARAMDPTTFVHRPSSKAPLIVALVAVMTLAAALVFFLMPRSGTLVVNVSDAKGGAVEHLEVLVDGTTRCESAPCIVRDVTAGVHEVKVVAKGYEPPAPRALTIENRRDVTTDFQLTPSKGGGTGFKVTSASSGVKLQVDGKDVGPLPLELHDLEAGEHKLLFAGDRYAPLEKSINVAKNEIVDVGEVNLKVLKGKATIQLGTPGAKVYLVNGATRKEVPQLPMAIEFDPNEKWELQATKDGYDELREPISFDDGRAEKTFTVTLTPKGAAPAPAVKAAYVAPKGPAEAKEPKNDVAATLASGGETLLKINSLPASSIVLDGKPIGLTPQPHVAVAPGSHTIMFVNAEQSLKKTITVDVKAGETKAAFAKLRD
jgi:hypothetical protein